MITDVLEIVAGSLSTVAIFSVSKFLQKRKLKVSEPLSYPFEFNSYRLIDDKGVITQEFGYHCPKCGIVGTKINTLCECLEFPRSHFHKRCGTCKFEFIMRTKDD